MRRFEWVAGVDTRELELPIRQTQDAAGYDLCALHDVTLPPARVTLVPTGVRARMPAGEFLALYARSSLSIRYGIILANGVGVIDADYVDNPSNQGHIMIPLLHFGERDIRIARGERIAQGVFTAFSLTDDDSPKTQRRAGGFGSTH
ncbi:dUTP diphosphatase [Ferroacidibacillus organovorans]|uniref:dUTP diphosphatase n=1 Tax=Ferroacidibacillus organovorans TaxID=1765683 RepID=A0A162UZW7_9BACL|nr:dUTP diphosphatase [Ferroacidibacillus organovorans]KYP82193.1 deoxyuridine 5'-triphosphate nucleotidohydrolase [Ferroacidibacillus organovorans]OAG94479.1 deoxyuridine 5'-triphosphate nucleotidohydrolase [Ferroacidibacillus organovorans]OPG15635.1 deoxyuridine 5'-triphosphate nucleotidohydrolase [Ferroacidibacillus organovorans]